MTKDEALKMAIEALEFAYDKEDDGYNALMYMKMLDAINACKEALDVVDLPEQPAQEPVAWTDKYNFFLEWDKESLCDKAVCKEHEAIPLYTHPHQWQGLTDDEIAKLNLDGFADESELEFARAIEQALRNKNE